MKGSEKQLQTQRRNYVIFLLRGRLAQSAYINASNVGLSQASLQKLEAVTREVLEELLAINTFQKEANNGQTDKN